MKIQRLIRLLALVLMIALASVLPIPLIFYKKDKQPKYFMEQIYKLKEEDKEDIKELN